MNVSGTSTLASLFWVPKTTQGDGHHWPHLTERKLSSGGQGHRASERCRIQAPLIAAGGWKSERHAAPLDRCLLVDVTDRGVCSQGGHSCASSGMR